MPDTRLFDSAAVVVEQPRRSWWRRYRGPALTVATVEGTELARVTFTDHSCSLLTTSSGGLVVRIDRHTRFGQFGTVRFRFTGAAGEEIGAVTARGLVKTRQLVRTEGGRPLLLTRLGQLYREWQLTETDPEEVPAPVILGRVTVSTVDALIGLQRYVVETDPGLDASERRTVVASVVCLHLLRRPPGEGSAVG
ncbi:hypothetical protein ACIA8J_14075 [Streptomyces asoensis]|uniref:hypothetical protein n=1 Tax=Streptomyces asoensis TaxID=249586 RepID=UPI00378C9EA3